MEELTAKINAVETVISSFAEFRRRSEDERLDYLEEQFPSNRHLKTYFNYTYEKLQDQLGRLQDQLGRLQEQLVEEKRKENLLQEEKLKLMGSTAATVQHNEPEVSESRKRRWSELNIVLEINKKATIRQDGVKSTGYSYVTWKQVEHIFRVIQGSVGVSSLVSSSSSSASHDVSDELLDALVNYLSYASICFGSITEGHEAKRVHFIAPVIIIVCSSFNGGIQILAEEDIDGNRVHAHGHFEFVLKRGDKRVCIVEAKKDDILQGKTQSLVGCESLSDVENLDTVYGIATNYLEWCFLKNDPDNVTEEILTVQLENNKPTKESLRKIANKICHILT